MNQQDELVTRAILHPYGAGWLAVFFRSPQRLRNLLEGVFAHSGYTGTQLSQGDIDSLLENQFRNLETGRGPGFVAFFGQQNAEALIAECDELAQGKKTRIVSAKTKEPIDGTEGRGLRQALADMILMLVLEVSSQEFLDAQARIIRRVWKGIQKSKPTELEEVNKLFEGYNEPSKTLASVPVGTFDLLIRYLIQILRK